MKNKQVIEYVEKVFNDNEANLGKQRSLLEGLIQQGQKEGNEFLIGVAYFYMSVSYYDESDYINMLTNALKAIEFIKDTNEYKLIARVYTILGYAYGLQGNFQLEYTNHEKAYQIVKKKRIKGTLLVTVLNNLAICYHELGQTSTPIKFYQECIDYVKESEPDNYDDLAMYSLNIAECYKDSNNVDKANEVLSLMEKWIDKVSFIPLVCDYYLRYSILSYHVNDIEKGNIYLDKAFELIPQNIYPHPIYDDLMKISKVLINNDDKKRVDIIINLMTNYSNIKKGTMEQLFVCRTMVNYYIHYGNNEKASFYQNKIEELYEERLNELKNSQLDVYNSVKKVEKEISLLKKQMKKSEVLLALEPMTKLLNRASLLKVSSEFIDYSYKKKCCVGAIFIDIDFFKECNDTYGHAVGDDVIKTLANICKEFETNDIKFARYGGDEFFGITRNLSDEKVIEVACNISKKIREMNIPNKNNPNGHIVTISSGVVNVPITRNTDTIIEIANYADKALYYAKNNGKNAIYQLRYDIIEDNTKRASYIKIDC